MRRRLHLKKEFLKKEWAFFVTQVHSLNVSHSESSITKIGRFLDGTLNKLLWGGAGQEQATLAGIWLLYTVSYMCALTWQASLAGSCNMGYSPVLLFVL